MAKVFERIINDQLYHYLDENNLLSRYQSGFPLLHSTVPAFAISETPSSRQEAVAAGMR